MRRAATGAVRTAIERTSPPADTARNGRETGSRSRSAGTFTRSRAKPSGWGEVGPPEEATAIEKAAAEFKVPAPIWGRRLRVEEDQWHYRSGPVPRLDQCPQSRQHRRAARAERDLESTPQAARAGGETMTRRKGVGELGDRKISDRTGSSANVALGPSPTVEAAPTA
jgi:hypothetical protein